MGWATFGVKGAASVIDRTIEVTRGWRGYAAETHVPEATVDVIERDLEARRRELDGA